MVTAPWNMPSPKFRRRSHVDQLHPPDFPTSTQFRNRDDFAHQIFPSGRKEPSFAERIQAREGDSHHGDGPEVPIGRGPAVRVASEESAFFRVLCAPFAPFAVKGFLRFGAGSTPNRRAPFHHQIYPKGASMTQVPRWFDRKFEFTFPPDQYPNLCMRLRGTPARLEEMLRGSGHELLVLKPQAKWS